MNSTRRYGIFIRFDERHVKMISETIKRTGERKVDFFTRIVETEHTRIEQGLSISETISETMNETLGTILAQTKESNSIMKTIIENTKAARDGANTIFPVIWGLTTFAIQSASRDRQRKREWSCPPKS